jgi:hypothetical protein
MDAVIMDEFIMDNAKAVDWRVLHAIELHQGYKSWRCRLSLDRIAKVARVSYRKACTSSRWWEALGVLKIKRTGKFNAYEIIQDFERSPEEVHRPRMFSHKQQKRGIRGKYAPSTDVPSSPSTDVPNITTGGNYNYISSPNVSHNIPPLSPQGETTHISPTIQISEETIKEWKKLWGPDKLKRYLEDHGYPLYSIQEDEEKTSPRGEEANNSCVPTTYSGIGENANEERP